jgi:hypothetical protein
MSNAALLLSSMPAWPSAAAIAAIACHHVSAPLQAKPQPSKQQDVPLPPGSDEDDDQGLDIGEEDLQFVQQYGAQLGFLRDLDAQQLDK